MKIIRNAIQCQECFEVIVSTHRHDFQTCKCGAISIDGGLDYKRRVHKTGCDPIEACAYLPESTDKPGVAEDKFLVWSPGGSKSNPGMVFDRHIDAADAAKQLATRVGEGTWYVAHLSKVC